MAKSNKANKKKVVLIHPFTQVPPFGIMSIGTFLKKNGKISKIISYTKEYVPLDKILNDINGADIIGISVYTKPMIKQACEITRNIRKHFDGFLLWGGVHSSLFPEQSIRDMKLDAVIINEGEQTLLELVNAIENKEPLTKVKGLYLNQNNKIIFTGFREPIYDMKIIPPYDWDSINIEDYITKNMINGRRTIVLVESRGCPFNCAFCYANKVFGRRWRGREPDEIISELKMLNRRYNISHFDFYDDLFFGGIKHKMIYFCDKLSKLNFTWNCNFRVNLADKETIKSMKKGGCKSIYFGVESGSPRILKKINKQVSIQQIVNAFNICNKVGIFTTAGFIAGFPEETIEDLKLTMSLMKKIKPTHTRIAKYVPYPGGDLYEECLRKGLKLPKHTDQFADFGDYSNRNINFSEIPDEMIKKAMKKANRISIKNTIYFSFRHAQLDTLPYHLFGVLPSSMQKPLLTCRKFAAKYLGI